MEDIPDITSNMLDRLRKLNINSVYQLAVQIPSELAFEISDIAIDVESAAKLIGNARKILTENELENTIKNIMSKLKADSNDSDLL